MSASGSDLGNDALWAVTLGLMFVLGLGLFRGSKRLAGFFLGRGEGRTWDRIAPGWKLAALGVACVVTLAPAAVSWPQGSGAWAVRLALGGGVLVFGVLLLFSGIRVLMTLCLVALGFVLPMRSFSPSGRSKPLRSCNNLKQIVIALKLYEDREGSYPEVGGAACLARLLECGDLPGAGVLDAKVLSASMATVHLSTGGPVLSHYEANPGLSGRKSTEWANPGQVPAFWERGCFWGDKNSRWVAFADGTVRAVPEAAFQTLLKAQAW